MSGPLCHRAWCHAYRMEPSQFCRHHGGYDQATHVNPQEEESMSNVQEDLKNVRNAMSRFETEISDGTPCAWRDATLRTAIMWLYAAVGRLSEDFYAGSERKVHILKEGLPLCGFSRRIPRDWPKGHAWIEEPDDEDPYTGEDRCRECFRLLRIQSPSTKFVGDLYDASQRMLDALSSSGVIAGTEGILLSEAEMEYLKSATETLRQALVAPPSNRGKRSS